MHLESFNRTPSGPLRLLGVQISNLEDVRAPVQQSLFGELEAPAPSKGANPAADLRQGRASDALDALRERYGRGTVVPASLLGRVSASRPRSATGFDVPRVETPAPAPAGD